jgi:hypothetical protein
LLSVDKAPKGFVSAVAADDPKMEGDLFSWDPNTEVLVLLGALFPKDEGIAGLFSPNTPLFVLRNANEDVAGLMPPNAPLPVIGTPKEAFAAGIPKTLVFVLEVGGRTLLAKTLFPPSEVTRPRILIFKYPTPNLFISVSSTLLSFCFFSTPIMALRANRRASPTLSFTI